MGLEWYHVTLIIMAVSAGVAAWEVPRAVLWLCLGALFYAITAYWHNMAYPYATLFGACTNFAMCLLLAWMADKKYELWVFNAFILMLVIDTVYILGFISSQVAFAILLEIVNAAAMLLITATGIAERVARHEGRDFRRRDNPVFNYCNRTLLAQRTVHHQKWWKN